MSGNGAVQSTTDATELNPAATKPRRKRTPRHMLSSSDSSLIPQRLCRQNPRSGRRRVQRRQQRNSNGNCGYDQPIERPRRKGQGIDGVDLGGKMDEVVVAARPCGQIAE